MFFFSLNLGDYDFWGDIIKKREKLSQMSVILPWLYQVIKILAVGEKNHKRPAKL